MLDMSRMFWPSLYADVYLAESMLGVLAFITCVFNLQRGRFSLP